MSTTQGRPRRWAALPKAAAYLDVTTETMRGYISQGYLVGYRHPNLKTIRVDLNDIDDMMTRIPSGRDGTL